MTPRCLDDPKDATFMVAWLAWLGISVCVWRLKSDIRKVLGKAQNENHSKQILPTGIFFGFGLVVAQFSENTNDLLFLVFTGVDFPTVAVSFFLTKTVLKNRFWIHFEKIPWWPGWVHLFARLFLPLVSSRKVKIHTPNPSNSQKQLWHVEKHVSLLPFRFSKFFLHSCCFVVLLSSWLFAIDVCMCVDVVCCTQFLQM